MRRKLVQIGQHTLMAAIPAKWLKRHHLTKGDQVEFTEVENKLVVTSTKEIYERSTEVHLYTNTIEEVWRVLQPVYTSGYDEVTVSFDKPGAMGVIQGCIHELIGFEITDTAKFGVKIKSISTPSDKEFESILRRTFLLLNSMAEITEEVLNGRNQGRLEEVKTLEISINKYTMYLRRIINRTGYKYSHYMYMIVSYLELAANHLEYLRRYLEREPGIIIGKNIKEDFAKLHQLIQDVYDLYFNYTDKKFLKIAVDQPHFNWFDSISNFEIRYNFKSMTEYLVQIARQIQALHT